MEGAEDYVLNKNYLLSHNLQYSSFHYTLFTSCFIIL